MTSLTDTHASTALRLRAVAQTTERTRQRFHEWLIRIGTALGASPPSGWRDRSPASGPAGAVLILRSAPIVTSPVSLQMGVPGLCG